MVDMNTVIAGNILSLLKKQIYFPCSKSKIKNRQILRMLSGQISRQSTRCLMEHV